MRVLVVTPIFPPDIGGHATAVPLLAGGLALRGHQVAVVTVSDDPEHCDDDVDYLFTVARLPRRLTKSLRWPLTIGTLIRLGRRADALLVYGLAFEATLANMVVRKPLVLKIVGDLAWERSTLFGWVKDSFEEFQRQRYAPKVELLKRLQAWWVRQADTVVVHSLSLVRRVEAWGVPPERLVVIPNAIVIPNAAAMPGRNGIATLPLATTLKVVTVARLVPWKGIEGVIEAATAVDGAGLVVVGDGPDRSRLERHVRTLGVADRVYFVGQRPRDETLALMAASDIFVLNSAWEGLSHTLLEAMALGLPVIATAVGASPEIVRDGETGRLIPPDDSRALRDALQSLAASPSERVRLAAGARRTVQRFSASVLVEEMEALLAASIARRNGRRAIQ